MEKQLNQLFQPYFSNNKIPHTFLLHSRQQQVIEAGVLKLANLLQNKNYAQLDKFDTQNLILLNQNQEQKLDREALQKALYQMSYRNWVDGVKILVIFNCDLLSYNLINALLKFIEEPFDNCYIIITTQHINQILPTIRSRAQVINLPNIEFKNVITNLSESWIDVISNIINDVKIAQKISSQITEYVVDFVKVIKNSLKNPHILKNYIDQNMQSEIDVWFLQLYALIIIQILHNKCNELFFNDCKVWKKLQKSNVDWIMNLELIYDFLNQNYNGFNFNLQKASLLWKIVMCYEKK
ncbi:hypothetical protein ACW95P_02880 [Candidatus Mycoplasma pogonae]